MRARLFASRFGRFIGVGLTNTLLSYVVFTIALNLLSGHAYRAGYAQMLGYGVGTLWSFFWNRRWTFASEGRVFKEALRFTTVQGLLLVVSGALMSMTVDNWRWSPTPTWITVMAFITLLNYLLLKYWVF